jgi:hypothetical protein
VIGRFITEDTYWGVAEDQLSLNIYVYCANNPIIFIDPSGHWTIEEENEYLIQYDSYGYIPPELRLYPVPEQPYNSFKEAAINIGANTVNATITTVQNIQSIVMPNVIKQKGIKVSGTQEILKKSIGICIAYDNKGTFEIQIVKEEAYSSSGTNVALTKFETTIYSNGFDSSLGQVDFDGGSAGTTALYGVPLVAGVDAGYTINSITGEREYLMGSHEIGLGISSLSTVISGEIHSGKSYTNAVPGTRFNIYDTLRNLVDNTRRKVLK